MSQSLSNILVHVVFSTKRRQPLIGEARRAALHAYLAGVFHQSDCRSVRIGGTGDHVHALVALGRTRSIASVIEVVKGSSSRWMLRSGVENFAWQGGYAVFSVCESQRSALVAYIARQDEHHRRRTFQEELRAFLDRNGVAYDERYLWD